MTNNCIFGVECTCNNELCHSTVAARRNWDVLTFDDLVREVAKYDNAEWC